MFSRLVLILIFVCRSFSTIFCPNGRPALQSMRLMNVELSINCSTPGEFCHQKIARCSKENVCCPDALRMTDRKILRDRLTNINFRRLGEDFRENYRLFQLDLKLNDPSKLLYHFRWKFFDETLRDLFEMPRARFLNAIINCLEKNGHSFAFVPLQSTSITTNISAMTVTSRKPESFDNLDVCYLATRKEHRRRGLGTRLLQEVVQYALNQREKPIRNVIIQVNTLNTVALELYERCGWRCFTYLPGYLDPDPHHATNHAFSLFLSLDRVKNVSNLCRDRSAIDFEPLFDQLSIERCQRTPVPF